MKFSLIIFVNLCVLVLSGVESYESHHKGSQHDSHSHKKRHSVKQNLLFPSGNTYSVVSPWAGSVWDCSGKHNSKADFVKLSSRSSRKFKKEYEIVKKELEKTKGDVGQFKGFNILKIEKVLNTCLWEKYKYRKDRIFDEAKKVNEKMLFHASSAPFVSARNGFDERYTTLEQGEFGAGLYFSDNPYTTHTKTKLRSDGTRVIMLCRVALGNVHERDMQRAHPKVGFQSVSSSDGTTTEYSIYRGEQAYPDYVITYKEKE